MAEVTRNERFKDNGELIYEFGDEFLVVCPYCKGKARVFRVETGSDKLSARLIAPRKLVCFECLHRDESGGGMRSVGGSVDWYFGLDLWLKTSCCGEMLWVYNRKHLDFLENYVSAKLRERMPHRNKSLASRLPKWIKSAKNRDQVLKAIAKLKEKLDGRT